LRPWREYKDLTQQQVADRVGATKFTISNWELGKRTPSLEAYAEAFGEPVEKLYQPPPEQPKPPKQSKRLLELSNEELQVMIEEIVVQIIRRLDRR
jgi:DNA-binding XRE family transcriptional regulator